MSVVIRRPDVERPKSSPPLLTQSGHQRSPQQASSSRSRTQQPVPVREAVGIDQSGPASSCSGLIVVSAQTAADEKMVVLGQAESRSGLWLQVR